MLWEQAGKHWTKKYLLLHTESNSAPPYAHSNLCSEIHGRKGPGASCVCIGLVACSTAQTTFWPLCRIFLESDICVMPFPISLKAARSCKICHCLCFLLLWKLLSQGRSVVLRMSPISQEDPLVCHTVICKVDHSKSLCHFSTGQDLTRGHWDPTALEALDAVVYTVSFQVRSAL